MLKFGPTAPTQKQTRRAEEPEWPTYNPLGENSWMYYAERIRQSSTMSRAAPVREKGHRDGGPY